MYWKKQGIKEFFKNTIEARRRCDHNEYGYDGLVCDDCLFILSRDYNETIEFLKNATVEEIACCAYTLADIAHTFPKEVAQEVLNIFKEKLVQYPDVEEYSECAYVEELELAQEIIEGR